MQPAPIVVHPVQGYPPIRHSPPTESVVKTLLFCISVVLAFGGAVAAVVCIFVAAHDVNRYYRDNYYHHSGHGNKDALYYGLLPSLLELIVLLVLGFMWCCCNFRNTFAFLLLMAMPTIGSAMMIGATFYSIKAVGALGVLFGFIAIVMGNVLMSAVLYFKETPLVLLSLRWTDVREHPLPYVPMPYPPTIAGTSHERVYAPMGKDAKQGTYPINPLNPSAPPVQQS